MGLIDGIIGGFIGGEMASVVNTLIARQGGLAGLISNFERGGLGSVAQSWVGTGANKDIDPNDLANSIGLEDIDHVAQQSGLSRDEMLAGLSQQLPGLVDQLTPDGRLPTTDELSKRLWG